MKRTKKKGAETMESMMTIRIPADLRAELEKRAEAERRKLSDLVRLLLEDALKAKGGR